MHVGFLPLVVVGIATFSTGPFRLSHHRAAVLLILGVALDESLLSLGLATLVIVTRASSCCSSLFIVGVTAATFSPLFVVTRKEVLTQAFFCLLWWKHCFKFSDCFTDFWLVGCVI